jgi:hypothetical protein
MTAKRVKCTGVRLKMRPFPRLDRMTPAQARRNRRALSTLVEYSLRLSVKQLEALAEVAKLYASVSRQGVLAKQWTAESNGGAR